ncbi:MAG: YidC/Oxa1 family membrane protein insertase [Candidatus Thiosymbion ectosymbiont of Robbea hypermnestra]|nr:YidC/Oxa1 family membrane protein insertase [Candidatus Thiosymbion ectosymbiont of Robbea hypermnestra]
MDEEAIQQIANAVMTQIKPELERLRADNNKAELRAERRNIELRKEMSKEMSKLREEGSRDRDHMERLENQMQGFVALGRGRGPEPVQYVSTGTGLIDPEWRWEREHPFRR